MSHHKINIIDIMFCRVLFVTAHPDDECLFFTPTITSLHRQGAIIRLLCLSTGNADGLGQTRREELLAACTALQIPRLNVTVIDDPRLQDGPKQHWAPAVVAEHVAAAAEQLFPDLVVTFDSCGVSGHPNHRATYRGVLSFLQHRRSLPDSQRIEAWALESVPLVRKYLSFLDIPLSLACSAAQPGGVCHIGGAPWLTWRAMMAHRSQLLWFRRLFVVFSRYTYINTLRRI